SDQAQVKRVAAEISEKWPRIDRLFNNAAVVGGPEKGRNMSKQGNEWHYEINTLAPYILTTELKPLLENSDDAKVITTVTDGMHSRQVDTDLMLNSNSSRTMMLYMHSKQAVMFLMNDLATQWDGVKFLAVNPGPNKTNMTTGGNTPWFITKIASFFFNDPSVGSQLIYNAGFDPQFAQANQVFLTKNKIVPVTTSMSADQKTQLLSGLK
ncbi:MAG: SDR family NAD(P)-dependent oxidoreductase, partial [Chloroflexota bacterium]